MPSHQSSISGSGRSASYGGASVHSDVAATAAPPTQRSGSGSGSGVRLAQPAGLESLSRRSSVRESRVGSGLGNMSRHSESLQYGQPAQSAQSSGQSGAWRESLQRAAGGSETGSKLAGPDGPGSGRVSIADTAVDNVYRVESLHHSISAQSDPPSGQSGMWRERSLQRAAGGSAAGSRLAGPDGLERPESGRVSIADYGAGNSGVGNMSRADSLPYAAPYTPSEPSGPEAGHEHPPVDSSGSGSRSSPAGAASAQQAPSLGSSFGIRWDDERGAFYDRVTDSVMNYGQAEATQKYRRMRAHSEALRKGRESAVPYYPENWGERNSDSEARYMYDELNDCVWDTTGGQADEKKDPEDWTTATKEDASLYGRSGKWRGSDWSQRAAAYRERHPLTELEKLHREFNRTLGAAYAFTRE